MGSSIASNYQVLPPVINLFNEGNAELYAKLLKKYSQSEKLDIDLAIKSLIAKTESLALTTILQEACRNYSSITNFNDSYLAIVMANIHKKTISTLLHYRPHELTQFLRNYQALSTETLEYMLKNREDISCVDSSGK